MSDFPTPTEKEVMEMCKKSVEGLVYTMKLNIEPKNAYCKCILELNYLLLEIVADNMADDETLKEFFERASRK